MSLQVWLPLTTDLSNQGLADVTVTNNGATYNSAGKLGGCYYFTPNQWIKITMPATMTTIKNTTVAAWVKSMSSTLALGGISNDTNYANAMVTLYSSGWQFSGSGAYKYISGGTVANTQVWHHVACTVDDTTITTYLDGVKVTSNTLTGLGVNVTTIDSTNFIEIGCDHPGEDEYLTGYVNDFRVYDHALSAKEVKELSKGLVLHYKLDGKDETTTNLAASLDGWTTSCYNGATNKYGYGTNTDIYKTTGTFEGRECTKIYMGTAGNSARPYVYISNIFTSDGTNQPLNKAISFDYFGTIGTYLNFYKLGSGSGTGAWTNVTTGQTGSFTNSGDVSVTAGKWNHIELVLTGTTAANAEWGYCILGDAHTSTLTNYWLFANMQIEAKDHCTPFAGYGVTRTYSTEYDCSGYRYDGAPIDATLISKDDSARYNDSLYFNGTTSGILIDNLNIGNIINTAVTYSFWIKPDGENGARSIYFGSYSGVSWSIEKTTGNVLRSYWNGSPDETCTGATITDGTWQHVCITKNGTSDIKVYINGVQKWSSTTAHSNLTFPTTFRIGRDTRSSDGTPYKGQMSDFRIYATALSAADVLELYHTSASVDNKGTVYEYELEEV